MKALIVLIVALMLTACGSGSSGSSSASPANNSPAITPATYQWAGTYTIQTLNALNWECTLSGSTWNCGLENNAANDQCSSHRPAFAQFTVSTDGSEISDIVSMNSDSFMSSYPIATDNSAITVEGGANVSFSFVAYSESWIANGAPNANPIMIQTTQNCGYLYSVSN